MSNAVKPTNPGRQFKTWDSYVKEAELPQFELPVDDDTTYYIDAPTGGQVIEAQRLAAVGDLEAQLRVICGDAADDILPLIKSAPAGAMKEFLTDVMEHFGYSAGEAPTSPH